MCVVCKHGCRLDGGHVCRFTHACHAHWGGRTASHADQHLPHSRVVSSACLLICVSVKPVKRAESRAWVCPQPCMVHGQLDSSSGHLALKRLVTCALMWAHMPCCRLSGPKVQSWVGGWRRGSGFVVNEGHGQPSNPALCSPSVYGRAVPSLGGDSGLQICSQAVCGGTDDACSTTLSVRALLPTLLCMLVQHDAAASWDMSNATCACWPCMHPVLGCIAFNPQE